MKWVLSLITVFLCLSAGQAQKTANSKRVGLSIFLGLGQSYFSTNDYKALSKFTSAEIRAGLGISKPVSRSLSLVTQVGVNIKLKAESLHDTTSSLLYHLKIIDATVSFSHHIYFEVPVLLSTHIPGTNGKLSIATGIGTRYWLPNRDNLAHTGPDFLSNQLEAGWMAALTLKLKGNLQAHVNYFHGMTDVYKNFDAGKNPMMVGTRPFEIRNRGYWVVLSYSL
ncbi:MAG: hypothetical protein ACOYXA_18345 [Bacteroidota bacterium]